MDQMEQGHPLSTIINSVLLLAIVASITQMVKIVFIVTYWPLTNDAVLVLGIIAAILTICNLVVCYTHHIFMAKDIVQGTAMIVLFSLAHLVVWAAMGSSILMMDLESMESYQQLFVFDVGTAIAQTVMLTLLQYLGYNLYIVLNHTLIPVTTDE